MDTGMLHWHSRFGTAAPSEVAISCMKAIVPEAPQPAIHHDALSVAQTLAVCGICSTRGRCAQEVGHIITSILQTKRHGFQVNLVLTYQFTHCGTNTLTEHS